MDLLDIDCIVVTIYQYYLDLMQTKVVLHAYIVIVDWHGVYL